MFVITYLPQVNHKPLAAAVANLVPVSKLQRVKTDTDEAPRHGFSANVEAERDHRKSG